MEAYLGDDRPRQNLSQTAKTSSQMSSLNREEFEFLHVKGGQDNAQFNGHSILHFDSATGCLALGRLQKIHLQVTDGSPCSGVAGRLRLPTR